MARYGYARVSSVDQDLTIQRNTLAAAGCTVIRAEQVSGRNVTDRPELRTLLDFIRQGDTLVVTRLDRLARSMYDLQMIVRELEDKGAALVMTEQAIDTSTPAGKAFVNMLGVFAEFERSLIRERQRAGIEAAKAEGKFKGKQRKAPASEIAAVAAAEGVQVACERFGLTRSSIYRAMAVVRQSAPEADAA